MRETTKQFIIDFLSQQHKEGKSFVFGGVIEDYLRTKNGSKGESTSRVCRMLENEGILEAVYIPRKDGGRPNVAYKLKGVQNEKTDSIKIKEESRPSVFSMDTKPRLQTGLL